MVVITPLLALPWTVSPLDVNKQTFFLAVGTLLIVAWLGEAILARRIEFRLSAWWVVLGVFVLAACVSAGLSTDAYTSVLGQSNQEYASAVTIVMMAGLVLVGAHTLDAVAQRKIILWSVFGSAAVGLVATSAFLGVSFGKIPTNVIGTPNALAVYLIVLTTLGCAAIMHPDAYARVERIILRVATVVTTLTTLLVLLAIDYGVLWFLALVGTAAVFGLAAIRSELLARPSRFILPMLVLVTSLFFLVLPTFIPSPLPAEISLTTKSTWGITGSAMKDGAWAFGSGPGTFSMLFSKYHDADMNNSTFWDTRFDRGSSGLLTMLPTFGIFATLAFLLTLFGLGFYAIRIYLQGNHTEMFPTLAAWLTVAVAFVVYPQNFTLTLVFWFLAALVAARMLPHARAFSFDRSPRAGFAAAFGFVLCAVFVLTVGFATIARYRADVAFARAVVLDRQGASVDEVILELDAAATANRWSDVYYRNLGSALLQKVIEVAQRPDADPEYVKSLVGAAVNAGVRATDLSSENVTNWELRGNIYREVSALVADAAQFAVAAYDEAIALAPTNPRYRVESARAYLALADVLAPFVEGDDEEQAAQAKTAQDTALTKASDALMTAITLKSDYVEARYYLAFVQERQDKLAEAIASMELVRQSAPNDVGVGLQLALLYLRQGKNDVAKLELERIIGIVPNFTNAHWYLASMLEEENDIDGAIAELETIMELDPGNETVQKKLDALKAGKAAAEEIPDPLPSTDTPTLPDAITP